MDLAPRAVVRSLARPAYSRFVGLMKWGLLALATLLVALVLAWPGVLTRKEGFRISFSGLRGLGEEQLTMLKPRFLGVDRKGQPYVITAETAVQDPADPRRVSLAQVQADITLERGAWLSLSASRGLYRQLEERLTLEGPVAIHSDSGYELHLERVEAALAEGRAWSDLPVQGHGPFGAIAADGMRVEDHGDRVVFEGRVRVTLRPGSES